MKSFAVRDRSAWSSVNTSCMVRSLDRLVRQAKRVLGDDIELHLAGAALDGVAARAQPVAGVLELVLVEARALPAQARGPAQRQHQLLAALVELGAVDL